MRRGRALLLVVVAELEKIPLWVVDRGPSPGERRGGFVIVGAEMLRYVLSLTHSRSAAGVSNLAEDFGQGGRE